MRPQKVVIFGTRRGLLATRNTVIKKKSWNIFYCELFIIFFYGHFTLGATSTELTVWLLTCDTTSNVTIVIWYIGTYVNNVSYGNVFNRLIKRRRRFSRCIRKSRCPNTNRTRTTFRCHSRHFVQIKRNIFLGFFLEKSNYFNNFQIEFVWVSAISFYFMSHCCLLFARSVIFLASRVYLHFRSVLRFLSNLKTNKNVQFSSSITMRLFCIKLIF